MTDETNANYAELFFGIPPLGKIDFWRDYQGIDRPREARYDEEHSSETEYRRQ
ncbi:MAG: hypothetical protein HY514_03055 [Candidatus Aenigmarchaeota archaeon]|nr:hypothetical protein [Candidatus Aenigmarchaeota archaeon]